MNFATFCVESSRQRLTLRPEASLKIGQSRASRIWKSDVDGTISGGHHDFAYVRNRRVYNVLVAQMLM